MIQAMSVGDEGGGLVEQSRRERKRALSQNEEQLTAERR